MHSSSTNQISTHKNTNRKHKAEHRHRTTTNSCFTMAAITTMTAASSSASITASLPTSARSSSLPLKLSQLQNFCKRDPPAYKEDYDAQFRRLSSLISILRLSPNADPSPQLVELIQFAAAVSSSSYRGEESDRVADLLIDLLVGSSGGNDAKSDNKANADLLQCSLPSAALSLHRDIRKACVSALILMRNKGAVPPLRLLRLFFQLMAVVSDKNLRESLYHHVVNDIRNINKHGKRDDRLNRTVQGYFHRIVSASASDAVPGHEDGPVDYAAKRAVQMTCDLYRRNVWNDSRSVHILATAASSPNASVASRALRFFLNIEEAMADDRKNADDREYDGIHSRIDLHLHSKKTKARQRQIQKEVKSRQRKQNAREQKLSEKENGDADVDSSKKLYPAIELLNDPQGLVETLLRRIKNSGSNTYKFEVKMLMLNFVTRTVGNHELVLLPLYPLLQRYMGGHQRDVTSILAYTVQSCHSYVPPEEIYPLLKTILHNFVTERCSGEQMAVGINAVRAICSRVPSVLSDQDDDDKDAAANRSSSWDVEAFVRDLAGYAKHRDRSVSIAGRGWVNFIREVYPSLLQGKDRGLVGSGLHKVGERPLRYGEVVAASGVEGADLLAEYEASKMAVSAVAGADNGKGENSDEDEIDGKDEEGEDAWTDVPEDQDSTIDIDSDESSDDEAPQLTEVDEGGNITVASAKPQETDTSHLSKEERAKLQQQVSSTRIFTSAEFAKMQKLVDRQQKARRDPRLAAKLKREKAKGNEYADLSEDDSEGGDSEDELRISGAVAPSDIMAYAKKKRMTKAEKLEKILEGRQKWEAKVRFGSYCNRYTFDLSMSNSLTLVILNF